MRYGFAGVVNDFSTDQPRFIRILITCILNPVISDHSVRHRVLPFSVSKLFVVLVRPVFGMVRASAIFQFCWSIRVMIVFLGMPVISAHSHIKRVSPLCVR